MNKIKGDLIALAKKGEFDVIAHGCNCFCKQKSGIAKQMVEYFQTNYYNGTDCGIPFEEFALENPYTEGDINKLGQIEWEHRVVPSGKHLYVVNCYTQYRYGKDPKTVYLDYEALALCMRKINHVFKGQHLGIPKIGCGLAGGNWEVVEQILINTLKDIKVTVVEL